MFSSVKPIHYFHLDVVLYDNWVVKDIETADELTLYTYCAHTQHTLTHCTHILGKVVFFDGGQDDVVRLCSVQLPRQKVDYDVNFHTLLETHHYIIMSNFPGTMKCIQCSRV